MNILKETLIGLLLLLFPLLYALAYYHGY